MHLVKNPLRDPSARTEHKDIGRIAAEPDRRRAHTSSTGRRAASRPFAPIVKTPNYSENAGNLTGYSVEIEDDSAPHGYRHMGNVSERYLLLPNADVRELGLEIAEASGLPYPRSRAFFDGGRFAHVIDFGEQVSEDVSASGDGSDRVGLSLVMRNSYDTSWRFEAALMGQTVPLRQRPAVGRVLRPRRVQAHARGRTSEDWREVVRQGLRVVHRAPHDLARFARRSACSGRPRRRTSGSARCSGCSRQFGDSPHREGRAAVRGARGARR